MCWFKRNVSKTGTAILGVLLLLVLMTWIPVSAAGVHEGASGLTELVTVTPQVTPTEDATVTALNKEKLSLEIQQLKNQNTPTISSWFQTNGAILIATLVVVMGAIIGLYRWLEDRRRERDRMIERDLRMYEARNRSELNENIEETLKKYYRETERLSQMIPTVLTSTANEIPDRVAKRVEAVLNDELGVLLAIKKRDLETLPNQYSSVQSSHRQSDQNSTLIRELSHTLNTPLSQIEAKALTIKSQQSTSPELSKSIDSILTSINLCKATLSGYRELILVIDSSSAGSPASLAQIIESAANFYSDSNQKSIIFNIDLPQQVEGYSNNWLTTLILPLLENAVEASPPASEITIQGRSNNGSYLFEITNLTTSHPPLDEMYGNGFTNKKEPHSGTGLTIVQHLLTAHRGASINHKYENNKITFRISLPFGG